MTAKSGISGTLAICLALGIQGCGKGELSRSDARERISATLKFPMELIVEVPKSMQVVSFEGSALIGEFQKSTLVTAKQSSNPGDVFRVYRFEFTEAGRKYLTDAPAGRTVRACTITMGDITGIQFDADKRKAEVEFDVHVEPNEFAKLLAPKNEFAKACTSTEKSNAAHQKTAAAKVKARRNLALFDDGWRVVR